MSYHDKARRAYRRARNDDRDAAAAFKAACLTNIVIAAVADAEVKVLRDALSAIAGDRPWPDSEMGYNQLARQALSKDYLKEASDDA